MSIARLEYAFRACGLGHKCEVPECKKEAVVEVDFDDGSKRVACPPHFADLIALEFGECPALFRSILGGEE
jgi:hypothetical protein